jgi:recombination protein RecT
VTPAAQAVCDALEHADMAKELKKVLPKKKHELVPQLIKRAEMIFQRNAKLQESDPASFLRCVLQAAEVGLAIDGKFAHAVPFWNRDRRCYEAQLVVDYKGLIAVARRNGNIRDAYARIVWEGERFSCGHKDGADFLHHVENPRCWNGPILGAYAILKFNSKGGEAADWRYEFCPESELLRIQNLSKSRDKNGNLFGPWVDHPTEMRKKTPIKRALKTYCDDEDLAKLIAIDELAESRLVAPFKETMTKNLSLGEVIGEITDKEVVTGEEGPGEPEAPGEEPERSNGPIESEEAAPPAAAAQPDSLYVNFLERLDSADSKAELSAVAKDLKQSAKKLTPEDTRDLWSRYYEAAKRF